MSATSNDTIIWQLEPATRGTWSIVSTCMLTLLLCFWTAVHLNLPGKELRLRTRLLRRAAWLLGGLFIPELLVTIAFSQYHFAQSVTKDINVAFRARKGQDVEQGASLRKSSWTLTHSFWATMGGLAIDPSCQDNYIPDNTQMTLTSNGVSFLLAHEPYLLPDISEEEIKDKSKSDSLAKTIACVQVIWFCVQCVARWIEGLPVSQLEITTFAHSICTVFVFVAWWKKPQNIQKAHVLRDERLKPLVAYMWMASKTSALRKPAFRGQTTTTVGRDPEFEAIRIGQPSPSDVDISTQNGHAVYTRNPDPEEPKTSVSTVESLDGTDFYANPESTRWLVRTSRGSSLNDSLYQTQAREPAEFRLAPGDVRRWQLARIAIDRYQLEKPEKNLDFVRLGPIPETKSIVLFLFNAAARNPYDRWARSPSIAFLVLAAIYGGIHLLGWYAMFPSEWELKLWRISALIVFAPSVLLLALIGVVVLIRTLFNAIVRLVGRVSYGYRLSTGPQDPPERDRERRPAVLGAWRDLAKGLLVGIFGVFYPLARGYLMWECLRTVFFQPAAVYSTTRWPQYFPHIA